MKVRFQTDADFDRRIVRATLRHEPAIDLQLATAARSGAGLRGIPDAQVLAVAAQEGRMLLSHDHHTMPRHFGDFIAMQESPGVIVMPQRGLLNTSPLERHRQHAGRGGPARLPRRPGGTQHH